MFRAICSLLFPLALLAVVAYTIVLPAMDTIASITAALKVAGL
jgi:hypothetical protein